MTIFHNDIYFILRCEVKRNKWLSGILLASTIVLVLSLILFYINEWINLSVRGADPVHLSRQWAINISFLETTLLLLISPFLAIFVQGNKWNNRDSGLFLLAPKSSSFFMLRWFFSTFITASLLIIFTTIYLYLIRMGLPVSNVVESGITLFCTGLAFSSIGFCMVRLFKDIAISLFLSYLVVFFLLCQVILAGPFIDSFSDPRAMIRLLMVTNGYIGVTSSFGVDIMRRGWLYEVSPIGMYRFDYPAWYEVSIFYTIIAVLFMVVGIWGQKRAYT